MEGQLRKRMQQVKELFHDCVDVFEELIAVKTHLAQKIEECHSAVENIQSSLNEVDASEPNVEAQIQVPVLKPRPPLPLLVETPSDFCLLLTRICVMSWMLRRSRQRPC